MEVIKLMRMKHYIKNIIILIPLVFSGELTNGSSLFRSIIGVIVFSLTSSIVYILNDISDVEKDRAHSTKRNRPIASGAVSIPKAWFVAGVLVVVSVLLNLLFLKDFKLLVFPLVYLLMNILYSSGLKNIPIVDVFIISTGFLLRLFFGGAVIGVEISNWLFLTLLFGTLFLGFGKRRNELLKEKEGTRKSLEKYSKEFLDGALNISLGLTLTFYSLWTMDMLTYGQLTLLTVPLTAMITFKYYHSLTDVNSGDPTDIFYQEKWLQVSVLILILLFIKILYI